MHAAREGKQIVNAMPSVAANRIETLYRLHETTVKNPGVAEKNLHFLKKTDSAEAAETTILCTNMW